MIGSLGHLGQQVARNQNRATLRCEIPQERAHPQYAFGVEAIHRLIKKQRVRITEHGDPDSEALVHTKRILADALVGDRCHTNHLEHHIDTAFGQPIRCRQIPQMVACGTTWMHIFGVEQCAYLAQRMLQVDELLAVEKRAPRSWSIEP